MTAHTEALRKCVEVLKQVDFKDCAESPELWHQHGMALAEAERVLRNSGETHKKLSDPVIDKIYAESTQQPLRRQDYALVRTFARGIEQYLLDFLLRDGEKPYAYEFGKNNGDGTYSVVIERGDIEQIAHGKYQYVAPKIFAKEHPPKPLYDHPASSPTAVVAVPRITQEQIDYIGEQWDGCMYDAPGMMIDIGEAIRAELAKINKAPQPAAAPSGDVAALQNIQRYDESDMEGGGVAPSRSGPYVKLSDVLAAIAATKE